MIIKCIQPFGNFSPGDELEVPDKAVFDETYFVLVPAKKKGGDE